MISVFVTGTDTGVGKTVVAASLVQALRLKGLRVGVMKPVACGSWEDSRLLKASAGSRDDLSTITPAYFRHPLSPNVAARMERKRVDVRSILKAFLKIKRAHDILVVEGCGGLLVPLTDRLFVVDLIRMTKSRCVLVSRAGLGAINHSLLSLEALRARGIEPKGVIMNRLSAQRPGQAERTNPGVVGKIGKTPVLGVFPHVTGAAKFPESGRVFLKHIDLEKIVC